MALLKPGDIFDHRRSSGLDAAVVAIDRLVPGDGAVPEAVGLLLGDEQRDILGLVAFEREQVKSALLAMILAAISRWQPMASMVTTAPSMASMSKRPGIATISFDFSATLTWPSTSRWRVAKADTMWIGAAAPFFW
jgi:hypothetical protein